jgi:hypothetical protein
VPTPRKRYFRVADKVLRKAWSNDELASLIRLMAYLNQRWARDNIAHDEAGHAEISIQDLMTITGRKRADYARLAASKWRAMAELTLQHRGDITVLLWPKFAEFQEFGTRFRAEVRSKLTPSASDSASDTKKEERRQAPPSKSEEVRTEKEPEWAWLIPIITRGVAPDARLAELMLAAEYQHLQSDAKVYAKGKGVSETEALKRLACRHFNQAKKNPDSVRWSQLRNARDAETAAGNLKRETDTFLRALPGGKDGPEAA